MPLKLKLDENGAVVVEDGKPVYVDDKGEKVVFDANQAMQKISALNQESADRRRVVNELTEKVKVFDGLDVAEAKKALETVKALDGKQLIAAKDIEKVRGELAAVFETEKTRMTESFSQREAELKGKVTKAEGTVHSLLIENAFKGSPHFSGENPLTNVLPSMAAVYFGGNFSVEGEYPNIRLVGKNPKTGEVIRSAQSYGDPADFETCISTMINDHPERDRMLVAKSGGSGNRGNSGNSGAPGSMVNRNDLDAISANLDKIAKGEVKVNMQA